MLDLNRVLAFARTPDAAQNEVRINFGVFAGRDVTPAEIDELAQALLPEFGQVTIVSEHRHELSAHSEVEIHQVRIELPGDVDPNRVVVVAEHWAQACIDARHQDISDP
ncbi:MAG: hypothetical protein ACYDA3_13210 [Gaiellaceae bacterium]